MQVIFDEHEHNLLSYTIITATPTIAIYTMPITAITTTTITTSVVHCTIPVYYLEDI